MAKSILSQVAGIFDATNFAFGIHPSIPGARVANSPGSSGVQTLSIYMPGVMLADGTFLQPFATNAPILVGTGANQETVTPTSIAVVTNGFAGLTVNITANFTNIHGQGDLIASGTVGLQEALNYASAAFSGGKVSVGGDWTQLGGTTAMLTGASFPAGTALEDNRGASGGNIQIAAGAADAVNLNGNTVFITKAGIDAMTLATPVAGVNDGLVVEVVSTTANAHTITTAANKINGNKLTATFGAAVGNSILLVAYQGVWYTVSLIGVTLT